MRGFSRPTLSQPGPVGSLLYYTQVFTMCHGNAESAMPLKAPFRQSQKERRRLDVSLSLCRGLLRRRNAAGLLGCRAAVVSKPVLRWILRDASCRNHHRHVILRFSGQTTRNTIVVLVRPLFVPSHFTHDP